MTPWDCQAKRIYKDDGVFPCLQATEANGEKPGSVYVPDKARSLTARNDGSPCVDRGPDVVATFQNTGRGWWNKSPIAQTLRTPCGGDSTKANLVAAGFKAGAGADARGLGYQVEQMPTLTSAESGTQRPTVAVYDMTHADEVMRPVEGGKCQTLNARMGTGGNQVPVVSYAIAGNIIGRENQNGGHHMGVDKDVSFTLNTVDRHAVAHLGSGKETVGCLMANCGTKQWLGNQEAFSGDFHIIMKKTVRRLTPTECERLQGLEDGYTLIDDKTCSDTARYKALGNGMAQPCADYVIRRIVEVTT